MEIVETSITVVTSLLGGAVGGILTAGKIARSGEKARARYKAEQEIRTTVLKYRATIVFDHDQLYEKSAYSKDYTSVAGQESFASQVEIRLSFIPKKAATTIRAAMTGLLGDVTYDLAVQRTYVPEERLDPDRESKRRALVLHQILKTEQELVEGLLSQMLASQNSGDKHHEFYRQALVSLDAMEAAVADKPSPLRRLAFWNRPKGRSKS